MQTFVDRCSLKMQSPAMPQNSCSCSGRLLPPASTPGRAAPQPSFGLPRTAERPALRNAIIRLCRAVSQEATSAQTPQGGWLPADNPEVEATYQACSKFLRSIGIENRAEIARILDIATNPNSLFHTYRDNKREGNAMARKLDVDKDMKPILQFFLDQGLEVEEIAKIFIEYPAVLCYSCETRLQPFFKYLKSLGIEQPERTVLQRPSLLGLDVEKGLRQMVGYLQANNYSAEQIEELLATSL